MTPVTLIDLAGTKIIPADLTIKKAGQFFEAVTLSPFAEVLDTLRLDDGREAVIVDCRVEAPQHGKHDIRSHEVFAAVFDPEDRIPPKALMLREDFPETLHLLLEESEKPRSLCLYDRSYEDMKVSWTGYLFLERVRDWLKLTAIDQLHQDDQPLEPLLLADDGIILIENVSAKGETKIYGKSSSYYGKPVLIASNIPRGQSLFPAVIDFLDTAPQLHGVIRKIPRDMAALAEMLGRVGIDFGSFLKERLIHHKSAGTNLSNRLLVTVCIPKVKVAGGEIITVDSYVFLTTETLGAIGEKLSLWQNVDSSIGIGYIMGSLTVEQLSSVPIGILRPLTPFHRPVANLMNGIESDKAGINFFAAGAGALGSQIIINLVRAGVGGWVVADPDLLFPHNQARHGLPGIQTLDNKAEGLARFANSILPGSVKPLAKDVITDRKDSELLSAIDQADMVIDMSASTAALRSLAGLAKNKRIASFFLNPSGTDLISIVQDKDAAYDIMALEVQYHRFLLHTEALHDHFLKDGKPVRYAGGCRDVSFTLPQDSIAIAAGISSKCIRKAVTDPDASICIRRTDSDDLSVSVFNAAPLLPIVKNTGDWTVVFDDHLIASIYERRSAKLPNETGGVLLGTYDMERKIIFIADIIGSPEDSHEYPTAYIRGIKDLDKELARVRDVTAGGLQYIGEWHSHPEGYGPQMSGDDKILFAWMKENMGREGLPALMVIAGHKKNYCFYVS